VFTNILLADEINRASPKTQSSLLEVMDERRVTYDGTPYPVPRPFLVLATQNPIELEGTYRLPEAELDRFLLKTSMGHPDEQSEIAILKAHSAGASAIDALPSVLPVDDAARLVAIAESVHVSDATYAYVAGLAAATRRQPDLRLGVSPRGSLALVRSARVLAAAQARSFVTVDDIKFLAEPVLAHRVILTPEAELQGHTGTETIARVLETVPVPQHR
jgi:MoxR-like ATPase